jgi:hypothetical protein
MFEAIGGRKFIAGLLTVAAGIAVHVMSKAGLTTELAAFLVAMYGAFSAANVAATISALKNGTTASAPTQDDATALALQNEMTDSLTRIEEALTAATDPAAQEAANTAVQEIKNGIALQNAAITEVLKRIGPPRQ